MWSAPIYWRFGLRDLSRCKFASAKQLSQPKAEQVQAFHIVSATIKSLQLQNLGRISYVAALEKQLEVLSHVQEGAEDTLLLLEHDSILTLGASFHPENLLHPAAWYEEQGIQVLPTDRGGDITYHGPGQLVAYPIFDVAKHGKDLHKWMRDLEETVIEALKEFDLEGQRLPVNSGVWINDKKVCAIGIKIKRWVSMHGIAINCDADLSPFSTIVPCGIRSHGVTSISQELGRIVTVEDFAPALLRGFQRVFPNA
jgi:lipoyl(octanoyl) transferase